MNQEKEQSVEILKKIRLDFQYHGKDAFASGQIQKVSTYKYPMVWLSFNGKIDDVYTFWLLPDRLAYYALQVCDALEVKIEKEKFLVKEIIPWIQEHGYPNVTQAIPINA